MERRHVGLVEARFRFTAGRAFACNYTYWVLPPPVTAGALRALGATVKGASDVLPFWGTPEVEFVDVGIRSLEPGASLSQTAGVGLVGRLGTGLDYGFGAVSIDTPAYGTARLHFGAEGSPGRSRWRICLMGVPQLTGLFGLNVGPDEVDEVTALLVEAWWTRVRSDVSDGVAGIQVVQDRSGGRGREGSELRPSHDCHLDRHFRGTQVRRGLARRGGRTS